MVLEQAPCVYTTEQPKRPRSGSREALKLAEYFLRSLIRVLGIAQKSATATVAPHYLLDDVATDLEAVANDAFNQFSRLPYVQAAETLKAVQLSPQPQTITTDDRDMASPLGGTIDRMRIALFNLQRFVTSWTMETYFNKITELFTQSSPVFRAASAFKSKLKGRSNVVVIGEEVKEQPLDFKDAVQVLLDLQLYDRLANYVKKFKGGDDLKVIFKNSVQIPSTKNRWDEDARLFLANGIHCEDHHQELPNKVELYPLTSPYHVFCVRAIQVDHK